MRILIVEDQTITLEALENAVRRVVPAHAPSYSVDVARWYEAASSLVESNSYDMVLLDHRMPHVWPECGEDDIAGYSRSLRNNGYGLIDAIRERNPETVIIGTSSLKGQELEGFTPPEYVMSKMWGEADEDLDKILSQIGVELG